MSSPTVCCSCSKYTASSCNYQFVSKFLNEMSVVPELCRKYPKIRGTISRDQETLAFADSGDADQAIIDNLRWNVIIKDSKITGKKNKGCVRTSSCTWRLGTLLLKTHILVGESGRYGRMGELTNIMIWREVKITSLLTRSNVGRSEDLKPCVQLRVKILFPGQPCHC